MIHHSDKFRVGRLKLLLLTSSLACLAVLLFAAFEENFTAPWRAYQTQYASTLVETAHAKGDSAGDYPLEIRQVYLEKLGTVDRCVTCHVGMDNKAFQDALQPLTTHSGDVLKHHPADKFGCTVCHQGQGRATGKDAAHGRVPFWDEPLLTGDFVQASCTKCHSEDVVPKAPVLSRGRHLLVELGCVGCHKAGNVAEREKVAPQLDSIGSKVSRKWLVKWLTNPKDYLPKGKMPNFGLSPGAVNALAAYLTTFHSKAIDDLPDPKGDYDAGATVYRESQCIVCHVTKLDYAENPVGGEIGPSLMKIGNKVNQRWLATFLKDPHSFLPHTKMPAFRFSDKQARDLAQFAMEEWIDYDLLDEEEAEPALPESTPEQIRQGKLLFAELNCSGCHDLADEKAKPSGPDLTFIGSMPVHQLAFGDAKVRHTVPDFLFTKLKSPKSLHHKFELPAGEDPVTAIWTSLNPASLFSGSQSLPEGSSQEHLAWILDQVQQAGIVDTKQRIPQGSLDSQAQWLVDQLDRAGELNPLKMPNFEISDDDAKALTIALMSLSDVSAPSKHFEVPKRPKVIFNPKDHFGKLERRYRCASCHTIRDSGELLASDITWEGNRVNQQWLFHFLNKPYSMRRMLTIAMPIFHFPEEESRFMANYISDVFVDADIGAGWEQGKDQADAAHGETLFQAKGCIACHQLHGTGGDVGPNLTTQVPEFPQGTWVGDKLRAGWIYQWLKNPQALLPSTIEPNLELSEQEVLDLTAFLSNLKNLEYQQDKEEK